MASFNAEIIKKLDLVINNTDSDSENVYSVDQNCKKKEQYKKMHHL